MKFTLLREDNETRARAGEILTTHGSIPTPVFMPVGTAGTVKAIQQRELSDDLKAPVILGNTYHLYLRPGMDVIRGGGGLHRFMNWNGALLTDSGGYQVFSLSANRRITEEGVTFRSHIDGSSHFLSPEVSLDIQRIIGADIMMAFDECPPYPADRRYAENSMKLTHRWLKRCVDHYNNTSPAYGHAQALFPIVQGSTYPDLRRESARVIADAGMAGNAIGGLSVGEPAEAMYEMTAIVCELLPADKPRYLMGVGTPANLLECIALGVDMFDCVMPTRNARHGLLFTAEGIINIRNEKWKNDFSPIDPSGTIYSDHAHSRAYLRHLMVSGEILGMQIATLHNLGFYLSLIRNAREHILNGTFAAWKTEMVTKLSRKL